MFITLKYIVKYLLVRLYRLNIFKRMCPVKTENLATVFMLHRVSYDKDIYNSHSINYLRNILKYLKDKNYNFVSLEDLVLRSLRNDPPIEKAIVFTIDDGYLDQLQLAVPVFIEFQCPVTIFLITDLLENNQIPWDGLVENAINKCVEDNISISFNGNKIFLNLADHEHRNNAIDEYIKFCKYLPEDSRSKAVSKLIKITKLNIYEYSDKKRHAPTWNEIRRIEKNNLIKFGSHSVSHSVLSNITDDRSLNEITQSFDKLKGELNNPVKIFAYPFGYKEDFTAREVNYLKEYGYNGAVTAIPGYFDQVESSRSPSSIYLIKRFGLPNNLLDLEQYASGLEHVKERLKNKFIKYFWFIS